MNIRITTVCVSKQKAGKIRPTCAVLFFIGFWAWMVGAPITQAQTGDVRIGDRVRIDAPKLRFDRLVGTVSGFTPTTVVLVTRDTTLIIPHDSIREFSVSRGKRRHIGKGSLIGAAAGGLVFAIGFRNSVNPCVDEPICLNIIDKKEAFNLGAIVGSMAGGFTGAIIGALIQTERWEKQPLPVSVSLAPTIRGRRPVAPTVSVRVPLSR